MVAIETPPAGGQLGLFAAIEAAEAEAAHAASRDEVGELLIEKGYYANEFLMELNGSCMGDWKLDNAPWPYSLPSRLFLFPVETHIGEDGKRHIGSRHPLMMDHPLIQRLLADGFEVDPNGAPNEYGYSSADSGEWHHAVDLVTSGMWEDLLKTRQFTCNECILGAVEFGLRYAKQKKKGEKQRGCVSTEEARKILAELEVAETSPSLEMWDAPKPLNEEKGRVRWPINNARASDSGDDVAIAEAWGMIHAIEQGWFIFNGDFLGWSVKGRERYAEVLA